MIVSPSVDVASNADVILAVSRLVADKLIPAPRGGVAPLIGSLRTNYFSFTFSVDRVTREGCSGVFVKIPKVDLRCADPTIFPILPEDRSMAEEEVRSLRILGDSWRADDLRVRWVALREYLPEYNAIVTDRVCAGEAFRVFRRLDLRRRLGVARDSYWLRDIMARMGTALARFHQRNAKKTRFRAADEIPKLERYCRDLSLLSRSALPDRVANAIRGVASYETDGLQVTTLKGIDIRNVLLDEKYSVFLLDPGRMKTAFREADLARFLMTYRILFWGSPLFALGIRPDAGAEAAFLEAYYANSEPASKWLLSFFLLKEQLKHWHTAFDSLNKKPWPAAARRLIAMVYIEPFYIRQLTNELRQLIR